MVVKKLREPEKGSILKGLNPFKYHKREKQEYEAYKYYVCHFSGRWAFDQIIMKLNNQYDETTQSVIPQRLPQQRGGIFQTEGSFGQEAYLMVYNKKLDKGYAFNTGKPFNKTTKKMIEAFKKRVSELDDDFKGFWIKDARSWGRIKRIYEMLPTSKKSYTMDVERKFWAIKNNIYSAYKKGEIKGERKIYVKVKGKKLYYYHPQPLRIAYMEQFADKNITLLHNENIEEQHNKNLATFKDIN
jgi:hypothetical protein